MKKSTVLIGLIMLIHAIYVTGQQVLSYQVKTKTDAYLGYVRETATNEYNQNQPLIPHEIIGKEAGINWQFTDAAAIGSKVKVSSQNGQTFNAWWLNDTRISMFGSSSNPLWEVPVISEWEFPVDMTEDGSRAVYGSGNSFKVYNGASSALVWELIVNGEVLGVKLSADGNHLFVAENNHNGTGNAYVSKYSIGQNTPLWGVSFSGNGTVFTGSKDCSRLVLCQYTGYNKLWVIDGANGNVIFDAFYANQNPPALSNDGNIIVNGDYSGNVYLYKYNETLNTYNEKWTYKVAGGGTSVWVVGMGVSGDGSTVAVGSLVFLANGSFDGEIYLFNSWSPVPLWVFEGTGDEVSAIDLSEDGSLIAAATWGPLTQNKPDFFLFRKESDTPIFSINTPGSFFSVDISDDGMLCAVTGKAVHAREFGNGGFLYNINSDPGGGMLSGLVDLENTNDNSNAKIIINELDDYFNRSKTDGSYLIKYIPAGTYTVTASKTGYYPVTISNVVITEGVVSNLNFSLEETGNPPYDLIASHGAGLSVDLAWNCSNAANILGFNIYRKTIPEDLFPEDPLATVGNNVFTFTDNNVLPLTIYYYAVTAIISADVESPFSNVAQGWMSNGFVTNQISVYVGTTPVIDGTITPGEWDDAFVLDASDFLGKYDNTPNPVGSVMMYFKNNPAMTELYVACINQNDNVLEDHDEVALYVDDNNDGSFPPSGNNSEGNYWAVYYASGNLIRYRPIYNNGGVGEVILLENPQIAVSNATGHIVYEFMIPIGNDADWKISPNQENKSGLFSFTLDDPTAFDGYWPCTNPQIFVPVGYGEITFSDQSDVPPPPENLDIWWTDTPPYVVTLEWNQPAINDFDHFNVYKSVSSGGWELLTTTIGTQILYISSNGQYTTFYVTTVDHTGQESTPSEIAIFDITIGLEKNISEKNAIIYPNPSKGMVNILFDPEDTGYYDLTVYGIDGSCVKLIFQGTLQQGLNKFSWDGKNQEGNPVPDGLYFLHIKGTGFMSNFKIIQLGH